MQAIVLEKKRFVIKIIPAVDKVDSFICTNGLKTVICAEGPVEKSYGCTTSVVVVVDDIMLVLRSLENIHTTGLKNILSIVS